MKDKQPKEKGSKRPKKKDWNTRADRWQPRIEAKFIPEVVFISAGKHDIEGVVMKDRRYYKMYHVAVQSYYTTGDKYTYHVNAIDVRKGKVIAKYCKQFHKRKAYLEYLKELKIKISRIKKSKRS